MGKRDKLDEAQTYLAGLIKGLGHEEAISLLESISSHCDAMAECESEELQREQEGNHHVD